MKTNSLPIVYLNAESPAERETLAQILSPYSWTEGEHGMILTDAAFAKCVEENKSIVSSLLCDTLIRAMNEIKQIGAGDVCLNSV